MQYVHALTVTNMYLVTFACATIQLRITICAWQICPIILCLCMSSISHQIEEDEDLVFYERSSGSMDYES